MSEKFLVVKLDQYAGNVDEIVCVALTGSGAERHGGEQARKTFNAKVRPHLENSDVEYPRLPIDFLNFNTEHGLMPYELDWSSCDNLRMCFDGYASDDDIRDMLDIWERAYGDGEGNLVITVDGIGIHDRSVTVKVIGFDLVEIIETRKTLR